MSSIVQWPKSMAALSGSGQTTHPSDKWGQFQRQMWTDGIPGSSPEAGLTLSAFWAALTLICEAMSNLSCKVMAISDGGTESWAYDHPTNWLTLTEVNGWTTTPRWKSVAMSHVLMSGNSCSKIKRNFRGQAEQLELAMPIHTRMGLTDTREPVYELRFGPPPATGLFTNPLPPTYTDWERFPYEEVLHLMGFSTDGYQGRSVANQARNGIRLSKTIETFGDKFFNKGRPSGFITKEGKITDTVRNKILQEWKEMQESVDNAFNIGILSGGLDWKAMGYTNDDAQYLQSRVFQVLEIARWFRIPPHMLAELTKATNSNIEQLMLDFLNTTMAPWCNHWEKTMNQRLFTPRERFKYCVRFDFDDFIKVDSTVRSVVETADIRNGVKSLDEVRAKRFLAPWPNDMGKEPLAMASQLDYLSRIKDGTSKLQGGGKDKTNPNKDTSGG